MAARLAEASVFASPARYEPFGLTVLEAALSGCALVLADIATFRELWDDAALFLPADDIAEWHRTLADLTDNGALARELGGRARKRSKRYSAACMGASYWEAYCTLLSAPVQSHQVEDAA